MPVKERISLNSTQRHASRGWMIACIALICVLVVSVGSLSVYTVLTLGEQRRTSEQQAASLTELEQALEQAQSELEKTQSDLGQTRQELEQNQSDASAALSDKDKTISNLEKTIDDLKKQIAAKKNGQTSSQPVVIPPPQDTSYYPGQKIVALTFDDGPGPYTAELLDLLKAEGVRATFFVLGTRVDAYPDVIRRMEAEGHEIGNHTNGHAELTKLSAANLRKEIDTCADKVAKLVGHKPTVLRCPYGSYNNSVKQYAAQLGVPIIQWDVDTRDWESRNVDAILNKTFNGSARATDGSIVLLHDIHKTSVQAMPKMIARFKQEGYTFVTVTELLHARRDTVEAGKVYSQG